MGELHICHLDGCATLHSQKKVQILTGKIYSVIPQILEI